MNDYTCFGGRGWLNFQDMNGRSEVKIKRMFQTGNVGKPRVLDSFGGVVL